MALQGDINGAIDYSPCGLDDNQQNGLQPLCFPHCIIDRQSQMIPHGDVLTT